jgi:group I intron endonuclease
MENNIGIYKITNLVNNRYYIGSSLDIKRRWDTHRRMLNKNNHHNDFLQKSWNKHGGDNFKF